MRWLVLGLGFAAIVVVTSARSPASIERTVAPRLASELPAWVAPGGRLRVSGWAGSGAPVELLLDERVVARGRAGARGKFELRLRAPEPGRRHVAVRSRGELRSAGLLTVRPLELAAVGDVVFAGKQPWGGVRELLRAADVATANLETAVSRRGLPVEGKEYAFRAPPAALAGMAAAGLDVLSVANNHTLDYGRTAFLDTLAHARAKGLVPVGGGAGLDAARKPAIVEAGGLRLAFLAYSDVNPLGFPAGPETPGTARAVPEHVAEDVRAARKRADVVICWFHWGEELRARPTDRQQRLAAEALNAGAHVVLGAHPHVLGEITVPRDGSLVAWTLGNFVFPSFRAETVRTAILLVRLDARGVRGHELVPVRIEGYRPVLSGDG